MECKREDRRIRRTKRLLIQALTKLMQQKQVNEITVKELTDLADINRGTFYLYYKDIFDMLEKIENEFFGKLEGIIDLREYEGTSKQVKDIIAEYRMDPSQRAMHWRNRERLIQLILDTARRRAAKGDAFRDHKDDDRPSGQSAP